MSKKLNKMVAFLTLAASVNVFLTSTPTKAYFDPGIWHIYNADDIDDIKEEYDEKFEECKKYIDVLKSDKLRRKYSRELKQIKNTVSKSQPFNLERLLFLNYKKQIDRLENLIEDLEFEFDGSELPKNTTTDSEDSINSKKLAKDQDQSFQNLKASIRSSLSALSRNIDVCLKEVQDDSIRSAFSNSAKTLNQEISSLTDSLDKLTLSDEIRNDDTNKFESNLDSFFSDIRLQYDSLKTRTDKLVKSASNASESIRRQIIAESKSRFQMTVSDLHQRIVDEFVTHDMENEYSERVEKLRADLLDIYASLKQKVDSVKTMDDIEEVEQEITLFNAHFRRSVVSKNNVISRYRARQRAERQLEAKSDFSKQLEFLRTGEIEISDVVGGYEKTIDAIKDLFETHRQRLKTGKGIPTKGLILYGEPGTGKTTLVNAVTASENLDLVLLKRSSKGIDMEAEIHNRFSEAKTKASKGEKLVVLLIDEIDALGSTRIPGKTDKETVALLAEIDDIKPSDGVVIVATTNMLNSVDEAVRRSGRLEEHCEVPRPHEYDVRKIFKIHFNGYRLENDMPLEELADNFVGRLRGCSGADLKRIAERAVQYRLNQSSSKRLSDITVYVSDVEQAVNKLRV